jgi:hypothetical protein
MILEGPVNMPSDSNTNPSAVQAHAFTPGAPLPLGEDEGAIAGEMAACEEREYARREEIYGQVLGQHIQPGELGPVS